MSTDTSCINSHARDSPLPSSKEDKGMSDADSDDHMQYGSSKDIVINWEQRTNTSNEGRKAYTVQHKRLVAPIDEGLTEYCCLCI